MSRTFYTLAAATALTLGLAVGSAQAVVITYEFAVPGDGSAKTSVFAGLPGFTTNTFAGGSTPRTTEPGYSGNFTIFATPSGTTQSASPAGNTTNFFSVPNPLSSGNATLTLNGTFNYFGLHWGSIDACPLSINPYNACNTIEFYLADVLVESIDGNELPPDATPDGNQGSNTSNKYVNFNFGADNFDTVKFKSLNYAFESDNHTYGQVPEPATLALLGAGLLGLGMIRRRKSA